MLDKSGCYWAAVAPQTPVCCAHPSLAGAVNKNKLERRNTAMAGEQRKKKLSGEYGKVEGRGFQREKRKKERQMEEKRKEERERKENG